MSEYGYLIDKIKGTEFSFKPFKHIVIKKHNLPNTKHAVKLEYDHLKFQRTQLYGNLWYHEKLSEKSNINDIDLISRHKFNNSGVIKNKVLSKLINFLYELKSK
jgi:hypothetical protein